MKKILFGLGMLCVWSGAAFAEAIVVIDGNGYVTEQIITIPQTFDEPKAQCKDNNSTVTVVRESPRGRRRYYYDRDYTRAAIAAGVTSATVGTLLIQDRHYRPRRRSHRYRLH